MATRGGRLAMWGLGGLAIGIALAFLLLNLVARTGPGHEFVLRQTLRALGKSIKGGTLVIGRVEGDLFQGARIYGLALRGRDGEPFILADSAHARYNVRTLLAPRIEVDSLVLFNPQVSVRKMPGDSLWNYQEIFADTVAPDTTRPRVERLVVAGFVRLVNARILVEQEWRPDSTLRPAARRRMVAEALADTSPLIVRQVPGGYVRAIHLTGVHGGLSRVRFAPGSARGTRIHVDSLAGNLQFYRTPARIDGMRGVLALFPDRLEFDAPELRFPGSRVSASGVVRTDSLPAWVDPPEGPAYDIALRGDTVAFRDFQWIYRRFPSDARGSMSLFIETRPGGTLFLIRDANLSAPGTRIAGSFGMVAGDTLIFTEVNLRARPVRVSLIERMLPDGLPVRGLVLGGAEIRGNNAGPASGEAEEEGEGAEAARPDAEAGETDE